MTLLYGLTFDQWSVILGEYPPADGSVAAALRSRFEWRRRRIADPHERSPILGAGEYRRDAAAASALFDQIMAVLP